MHSLVARLLLRTLFEMDRFRPGSSYGASALQPRVIRRVKQTRTKRAFSIFKTGTRGRREKKSEWYGAKAHREPVERRDHLAR